MTTWNSTPAPWSDATRAKFARWSKQVDDDRKHGRLARQQSAVNTLTAVQRETLDLCVRTLKLDYDVALKRLVAQHSSRDAEVVALAHPAPAPASKLTAADQAAVDRAAAKLRVPRERVAAQLLAQRASR